MKKKLLMLVTMMPFLSISAQSFSAVTPSGHTLYYMVTNNTTHEVSICRYNPYGINYVPYNLSGSLIIPDTVVYEGINYTVTGIYTNHYKGPYDSYTTYYPTFSDQPQLTSVTFPNTMVFIDRQTFQNCPNLMAVNFNNGLQTIGHYVFEGCTSLTSISLPSSVTSVGTNVFAGCINLTNVTLQTNANIGVSQFQNCTSLTTVIIPGGVTSIGDNAFNGCTGLINVTIQDGVTCIGNSAFSGCTNLTQINIPNTVTIIGTSAFGACGSLQNLVLPNTLPYILNGLCQNCTSLESVSIPNTVAYIQSNAFAGCSSLFSVTVPNSVLSIENNAFDGVCNVVYNGTATGATWGASYVNGYVQDSILYSDNTKTTLIKAHHNIYAVNIPSTVTTISEAAFQNCANITSLTLGNNIQIIGNNAFSECTGLNSLTLGNNVQSIGHYAFWGCTNLASLSIGNNVQSIGQYAFAGCTGLTTLNYNTAASAIGLFGGCTSLSNVTLGNNVTAISDQMFYGCTSLNTSPLTNNIQTIGEQAFYNAGLSSVVIPQACTYIGSQAFNSISMVIARPVNPPLTGNNAFLFFSYSPTIIVPCGRLEAYQSAWYQYQSYITEPTVDFELNVQASEGGQAQALTAINCADSTATIQATNDYGYHFDHWSDGSTDNPRTIHVTRDTTVTALFARNSYTVTLNSSNEALGSTTGGGSYLYGDTATLMAVPTDHYHFLRWHSTNYYGYEINHHENPLAVVVTGDMVLTADFAIDTYYVNVVPNEVTRGSVTGGGYAEYGTAITVSATPYSGYQFVRWSNGAEYNPYTFAVTNDMTLEAVFMEEGTVYHVEATSDNSVMGTVTGGGPYATGETAVLTAVAYPGYHFVRWQDNATDNPRSYLVTQDATFVAYFEANVGIEDIEVDGIRVYAVDGRIVVEGAEEETVRVFDIMGRSIGDCSQRLPAGVYLVKVGNLPARKVVVIK